MSYEISKYSVEKLGLNADIQPGFAFKSDRFTDNPDDIPLVKGENVHQGYVDWLGAKHWSADEYDSLEKYHLVPGDVVLAMDRPWVTAGLKWSYIRPHDPKSLLVQRVARIRAKNKLDQDYLRHVVSSSYFANYLQPIVTGVNVPHISGKQIGAFLVPIPDPETQRKIAAILTAYDDLIETNKRRIVLLENMAEEIYREWFVRMRFPGHQDTRFIKGVPEGWENTPIGELTSRLSRGISPKYSDESERLVINQRCIRNGEIDWSYAKTHAGSASESKQLKSGDILINSTGVGTLGRSAILWVAMPDLFCDSHVTICRADSERVAPLFLGFSVRFLQSYFENLAIGSTGQTELNQSFISRTKILVPTRRLQDEFQKACSPKLELIDQLRTAIQNLTKTRDLLLPRLISGKLFVDDLDIQFPSSMLEANVEQETLPEACPA